MVMFCGLKQARGFYLTFWLRSLQQNSNLAVLKMFSRGLGAFSWLFLPLYSAAVHLGERLVNLYCVVQTFD